MLYPIPKILAPGNIDHSFTLCTVPVTCSDSGLQAPVYPAPWAYSHGGGELHRGRFPRNTVRVDRCGENPDGVHPHPAQGAGRDTFRCWWAEYWSCMALWVYCPVVEKETSIVTIVKRLL